MLAEMKIRIRYTPKEGFDNPMKVRLRFESIGTLIESIVENCYPPELDINGVVVTHLDTDTELITNKE